jgi:uncharacterized cupredoxin-like copper-binding protein
MRQWIIKILLPSFILILISIFGYAVIAVPSVEANNLNLSGQTPIEISLNLGTSSNELKFEPNHLEFKVGQKYKLLLSNPSSTKHYFTAKDFADKIWTQKVDAGNVEIKGAINELELRPGSKAQWVFIPMKAGIYDLHCSITGHTEAGMVGQIIVSDS